MGGRGRGDGRIGTRVWSGGIGSRGGLLRRMIMGRFIVGRRRVREGVEEFEKVFGDGVDGISR